MSPLSGQGIAVTAIRLAAGPAVTGDALHARRVTVPGQRPAGAQAAVAASGQAGSHQPVTYFHSSVQVEPPFRGQRVRSATAPGTIGTGVCGFPAGPPFLLGTGAARPFTSCYLSRTPSVISLIRGASPFPAIAGGPWRAGSP
jgi:hypothetical protein